jgi:hypothetical protein
LPFPSRWPSSLIFLPRLAFTAHILLLPVGGKRPSDAIRAKSHSHQAAFGPDPTRAWPLSTAVIFTLPHLQL